MGNQATRPLVDWNAEAQSTLQQILSIQQNENVARNVILFLGDGMGISTVTAGRIYAGQLKGQTGEEHQLAFDKFPNVALAKARVFELNFIPNNPTLIFIIIFNFAQSAATKKKKKTFNIFTGSSYQKFLWRNMRPDFLQIFCLQR